MRDITGSIIGHKQISPSQLELRTIIRVISDSPYIPVSDQFQSMQEYTLGEILKTLEEIFNTLEPNIKTLEQIPNTLDQIL